MDINASIPASEISKSSNEDGLLASSIYPSEDPSTVPKSVQHLMLCDATVNMHSWTNLARCMKFIQKYGRLKNHSFTWMRRTLHSLSRTATPQQIDSILNGYADLYQLDLNIIRFSDDCTIHKRDISSYGGTSSKIKQKRRCRKIAYIMYDFEKLLFAPWYATHKNGELQTCFANSDENIMDNIVGSIDYRNFEILQNPTSSVDDITDKDEATVYAEPSHKIDKSSNLCLAKSSAMNFTYCADARPFQNEAVLRTTMTGEDNAQYITRLVPESVSHCQVKEIFTNQNYSLGNDLNSSTGTGSVEKVSGNIDYLMILRSDGRPLIEEFGDAKSMETNDQQHIANDNVRGGEWVSKNIRINTTQSKIGYPNVDTSSSKNIITATSICAFPSTAQPTTINEPQTLAMDSLMQPYGLLKVTKDPKRYRRVRMLKDLQRNKCPLIQAGEGREQRKYLEIEVPINDDVELFVRIRATTEDQQPHSDQTVAPENARVNWELMTDRNERTCLQCDPGSFDARTGSVYLKINNDERRLRRKTIKIRLLKCKRIGLSIEDDFQSADLRKCRIEFQLCTQDTSGQYQLVSQPSYTTIIELQDGDVAIDPEEVEPKQLCELGAEKISVPLSVACNKKDFRIKLNGIELKRTDFIITRKSLLLTSPPKEKGIEQLHLVIMKTEHIEETAIKEEHELYDGYIQYVTHDKCMHSRS
ncbi:unnamed protein product [Rotaria socialis]|uniref:Uncharacterized protein n=2 Tax=Rotaria socialis TaxID=392032 RepID=A0A820TKC9_9BILA|nr:unnamed protein product [Rotaria socialis]CAF3704433.1 unnamed protein product [Rotaria socialis]CAF4468301.1 unnamed protein product [Rotaria socialis]